MTYDPESSPWTWHLADMRDLTELVDLTESEYNHEMNNIYTTDRSWYSYLLGRAIWDQINLQGKCMIALARHKVSEQVLAYSWLTGEHPALFSQEQTAEVAVCHIRQNQPLRSKIQQCEQMIEQWQRWCLIMNKQILVSSTIRSDQKGFLRLHERAGFTIRGSIAYKRL